ncbi:MAG: hypothetical protein R2774_02495 [Saprospiraceae bacterium]
MNRTLLMVLALCLYTIGISQNTDAYDDIYAEEDLYEDDPYFWSYSKEIGLNMTPLLSKFIPFNFVENNPGLIGFKYKRYYSKRALRFSLGATTSNVEDILKFIHLSVGVERRYPMTKDKHLTYSSSYNLLGEFANDKLLVALSKGYGIEYHFTKRVFIGTEAFLQMGLNDDDGLAINFVLPAAIFLHVRLY